MYGAGPSRTRRLNDVLRLEISNTGKCLLSRHLFGLRGATALREIPIFIRPPIATSQIRERDTRMRIGKHNLKLYC